MAVIFTVERCTDPSLQSAEEGEEAGVRWRLKHELLDLLTKWKSSVSHTHQTNQVNIFRKMETQKDPVWAMTLLHCVNDYILERTQTYIYKHIQTDLIDQWRSSTSLKLGCLASWTSCRRTASVVVRKAPLCFSLDRANKRSVWLWKQSTNVWLFWEKARIYSFLFRKKNNAKQKGILEMSQLPPGRNSISHNVDLHSPFKQIKSSTLTMTQKNEIRQKQIILKQFF